MAKSKSWESVFEFMNTPEMTRDMALQVAAALAKVFIEADRKTAADDWKEQHARFLEMASLQEEADKLGDVPRFLFLLWAERTPNLFAEDAEYIHVYALDPAKFKATRNKLRLTQAVLKRYKNPDNDGRGPWQSVSANAQDGHATDDQFYDYVAPNGMPRRPGV